MKITPELRAEYAKEPEFVMAAVKGTGGRSLTAVGLAGFSPLEEAHMSVCWIRWLNECDAFVLFWTEAFFILPVGGILALTQLERVLYTRSGGIR